MVVKPSFVGAQGFDINRPLSGGEYVALKSVGMDFAFRYVPLNAADAAGHITNAELNAILASGLAVLLVQNVDAPPWSPTAALGTSHGSYAASYAKGIGYPSGAPIYCDLEMVSSGSVRVDIVAYLNNWMDEVSAAGFVGGLYVGYNPGLTPGQLYADIKTKSYWAAYNYDDGIATRGFQILQHVQKTVAGLLVDPDTIQADELGDLPIWLAPN
jgi:hypothetical protein